MAVRNLPIGALHRALKRWPCAVCIDNIPRRERYWLIERRRWCLWCALLFLDQAPEDIARRTEEPKVRAAR